jgi:hypothetical protein
MLGVKLEFPEARVEYRLPFAKCGVSSRHMAYRKKLQGNQYAESET